jgi:hypothetical protein
VRGLLRVPAGWVAGDEVYGAGPGLRAEFEASGIGYVLAVAVAGRRWTIEERFQTGQRLCVSSLKERGRSMGLAKSSSGCRAVPSLWAGGRQPADGINGGAPAAQRGRTTLGPSRVDAG